MVFPSPSCPLEFTPQPHKVPSFRIPMLKLLPTAALDHTGPLDGATVTNEKEPVVVPLPNCPELLVPEALRLPSVFNASVKTVPNVCPPDSTLLQFVSVPV